MNTTTSPMRTRSALSHALRGALQWRLWLLWIIATGLCALIGAMPVWNWLGSVMNYSLQSGAVATGKGLPLLLEALTSRDAPLGLLAGGIQFATLLMVLISPFLAGATVAASRSNVTLRFGDLLRGGIGEYGPMLRMLIWSIIPLGIAVVIGAVIMGANSASHENAVLAADLKTGSRIALVVGGILWILAHASLEAGRGWLAADGRLRSALKAWWRGVRLLRRRPVAVLGVYLVTTIAGLLLALVFVAIRQHLDPSTGLGFLLAMLAGFGITAALAWSRIARLFGMQSLALDMHARR